MVGSTTSLPSKHLLLEPQLAVTPSLTYTRALLQKSHTLMIYTHVLNRGGRGVMSPADLLGAAL